MKFRKNLFEGITFITYSLFMFIASLVTTVIFPHIILIIMTISLFIVHLMTYLFLVSTLEINDEGISLYRNINNKAMYKWSQVRCYQKTIFARRSVLLITLKDDSTFYIDNRKIIMREIQKYCGDIPDITDIAKDGRGERYSNYVAKFIDLSECKFELINSNTEHCLFCNVRTNKINENCYYVKKNNRMFYICPKCFEDFQKYCRFKIKK